MMQSHTPPVMPSPARLGMTNAHSPSLPPNPTPNPNPKPAPPSSSAASAPTAGHHHPATAATTTSSALLSLLPPLPRAQALLAQMASLATKLFDVSPHRAHWLASFRGSLPSFLPSASASASTSASAAPLHSSSSSSSAAPSSAKEVVALFTALQTQIFEAVAELQEILDLQDSRLKLAREIRAKDSTVLSFTKKIREAEQVLDQLVDDYSDYRRDPKRPKSDQDPSDSSYSTSLHSSLDLQEILSYPTAPSLPPTITSPRSRRHPPLRPLPLRQLPRHPPRPPQEWWHQPLLERRPPLCRPRCHR